MRLDCGDDSPRPLINVMLKYVCVRRNGISNYDAQFIRFVDMIFGILMWVVVNAKGQSR